MTVDGDGVPARSAELVGEWVQVDYFNEGLMIHPMHLHGLPQLVVAKDGIYLDQPYFADTINIAPGGLLEAGDAAHGFLHAG